MSPANNDYGTAIVLQGGGAQGASELGVSKALYEERPGFEPAVITGVSIAPSPRPCSLAPRAIERSIGSGEENRPYYRRCQHFSSRRTNTSSRRYSFRSLAVMGNPGIYQLRPQSLFAPLLSIGVCDTAPLRRTLAEMVIRKGATNDGASEVEYFDYDEGRSSFEDVIASGSLPPGFPMSEVDGDHYWDGGLFTDTPLSPAINRLEELETDKRELVVIESFPREVPIPDNLSDVVNRTVQLQFTNRLKLDEKLFEKSNGSVELVERIDESVDPEDAIRQEEGYKELRKQRKSTQLRLSAPTYVPN